jgi:hypothetical protein
MTASRAPGIAALIGLGGICMACSAAPGAAGPIDAASDADATAADAPENDVNDASAGSLDDAARASDGDDASDATADDGGWRSLLSGATLAAWTRYLGKPSPTEAPLGLENDPRGVFSIVTVDGEPAIHISGEVWGALISKDDFCDFHLRLQYKWGTAVWPPLNVRDSGVMWLSTGPLGAVNGGGPALADPAGSGAFMVAIEYQLTVAAAGQMDDLGPISFQGPDALLVTDPDPGAWKQVDIIFQGGAAEHLLNGQSIATGSGFELDWPGQMPMPLHCGKLQLQSEGGEIFFRRIEIQTF